VAGVNVALGILTMAVFIERMGFLAWAAVEANRDPNSPKLSESFEGVCIRVVATFGAWALSATVWPETGYRNNLHDVP
jgi:hypothetical protein